MSKGKVHENEEQYRIYVENANDIIYTLSPEGNFDFVSDNWKEVLGHDPAELIGKSFKPFVHPHDVKACMLFLKKIIETGKKQQGVEYRVKHKDGYWRWHTSNASPLKNEQGKVVKFLGIARDITKRKEVEEALQASEENLRITLNSIGDAVISTDVNGDVDRMNPVAEKLTGWKIQQAKGKPLNEIFNIIDARTRKQAFNPVNRVLETGKVLGLANHTILISRDQKEYQVADSAAPIRDDHGNIAGVVLVFRDVTEEYQLQEKLKIKTKALSERVKELNCLYKLSKLVENKDYSLEKIYRELLLLIPPAWQYPSITYAKLIIGEKEFTTCNFQETAWQQKGDIFVNGQKYGSLIVGYLDEKPPVYEGPFLKEEKHLLQAVIERLEQIIEYKRAEEETKKFKTIADKAVHGNAVAGLNGNLVYVNKYFANVHGYAPDELTGRHLSVFHNKDQIKKVKSLNELLINKGSFESLVVWHSHKDGSVFPMQMSGVLIKDEHNNPLYIAVTAIDITENIKNQETIKLRLSYEEAVSKVSALLLTKPGKEDVFDETLKIIQNTTHANRVYVFENFTDPVDGLCMKQTHEITQNASSQIDNPILQHVVYVQGFKRWMELLKNGKYIKGSISDFPIDEQEILSPQQIKSILVIPVFSDGKWFGFIGFDDTQTERKWREEDVSLLFAIADMMGNYISREKSTRQIKRSEEKFRALFEHSHDAIAIHDVNGNVIAINNKTEELTGYPRNQIINTPFTKFLPGDKLGETTKRLNKLLETGYTRVETKLKKASGKLVDIDISAGVIDQEKKIIQVIMRDISEQKAAETALRDSEENLKTTLNSIGDGVIATDIKGCITRMNPVAKQLTGYTFAEAKGKPFIEIFDIINAKTRQRAENPIECVIKSGEIVGLANHTILISKDKKERQIADSASPIRDAFGNITGVVLIFRDVTEEYQIHEKLKESEVRYKNAERIAHFGSWEMDIDTGKCIWSDEFFRICGYEPGSFEPTAETGFKIIHPEDRDRAAKQVNNAIEKGKPYDITKRIIQKDRSIRWVRSSGEVIRDIHGKPMKLIGSFHDITQQKRAEEKFKSIFEYAPDAYYINDRKGLLIDGNKAAEKLLGYEKNELINKNLLELNLLPLKQIPRAASLLAKNARGMSTGPDEFTLYKKSRKTVEVEITTHPIRYENKTLVLGIARDINKRKQAEKELKKMNMQINAYANQLEQKNMKLDMAKEEAEIANRAKSEFLANISHEIRTPLNAIIGFADIINNQNECPNLSKYSNGIKKSGETLLGLINDILDISKIEAGHLNIHLEYSSVKEIANYLGHIFLEHATNKGIDFKVHIDKHMPSVIQTDELRLRQILINLVGNSIKFTEQGSVSVSFMCKKTKAKEKTTTFMIIIKDTGVGISAGKQKSIFEPFCQEDSSTSRKYGGTGLGLYITKKLVAMLEGEIQLKSKVNKGTEFTLLFPLTKIADHASGQKKEQHNKEIELSRANVLIVEDIHSNREVIKGYLEKHPLEISEAIDGEQALEYCKRHKPDLILMDIRLPGIDGVETTTKIKGIYPEMPVIAVTASFNDEEGQELDIFDDYLQKPICRDDLLKTMAKYINSRELLPIEEEKNAQQDEKDNITTTNLSNISQKKIKEYHEMLHKAKESGNLDETAVFSKMLIKLGEKYKRQALVKYGEQLHNASEVFDIEEIYEVFQKIDQLFNQTMNKK